MRQWLKNVIAYYISESETRGANKPRDQIDMRSLEAYRVVADHLCGNTTLSK